MRIVRGHPFMMSTRKSGFTPCPHAFTWDQPHHHLGRPHVADM